MGAIQKEGIESTHVTDSTKLTCRYCGGVDTMISSLMDDPNDITEDTEFAALLLSITGGSFQGLVGLCSQCGKEWVPLWYCFDVGTTNAGVVTMANLDQATTADLMVGLYMIPMVGTDIGKYFIVATNTAAGPTLITPTIAPNNDSDGIWMITNVLPLGLTVAT